MRNSVRTSNPTKVGNVRYESAEPNRIKKSKKRKEARGKQNEVFWQQNSCILQSEVSSYGKLDIENDRGNARRTGTQK